MPDNLLTPRAKLVLDAANIVSQTPTIKNVAIALLDLNEGVHFHVFQRIKIDLPSLRAPILRNQLTFNAASISSS